MDEEVERVRQLIRAVSARVPVDAAALLAGEPLDRIAEVLGRLPKRLVRDILEHLPPESRPMDPMSITTEMMVPGRSEERRVGKGCVRTCRSRWSAAH